MISSWSIFFIYLLCDFAVRNLPVEGDVTLIKAEIQHNNITIPKIEATGLQGNANFSFSKVGEKKETKFQSDKSHRKSEIYVVNNGLLFLHPKKIETALGVKKSTEPIPPSINYHVIKKLKSNSSISAITSKILASHVQKRSVGISKIRTKLKSKKKTNFSAAYKKLKKECNKTLLSKFPDLLKVKKTLIQNPLFDNEQSENVERTYHGPRIKDQDRGKRKSLLGKHSVIKKVPDIKKDFEKLEKIPQYPRFGIHHGENQQFPRFPVKRMPLLDYPRFPVRENAADSFPHFPKLKTALLEFPRFPETKPLPEFPQSQKKSDQILEFPQFGKIKPLSLENFPEFSRYPEATAIPEIKEIGDTGSNSRSKRDSSLKHGRDNDNDDDDDDDDDYDYVYPHANKIYNNYYQIDPIGSIPRIHRPPSIPLIPDIPMIPELPFIPSLHAIKGITPIPYLKPIPPASNSGDTRSVKSSSKDKATVQNENIDVKSMR